MIRKPLSATRELAQLLKPFWPIVLVSILLGILGGFSVTTLLATINRALNSEAGLTHAVLWLFAGLCVLTLLSSIFSDMGTNFVGQKIIAKLRKELGEKVLSAPIEQIERYRSHRLIPVLTHDIDTISDFSFAFAPLTISLTVTLGLLPLALWVWVPVTLEQFMWLGLVAGFATTAHYCMTRAFRVAPLTVTQPVTFLQLVWATLLGALVFGEGVDLWVILGGGIIIAAISWITFAEARERARPVIVNTDLT